GCEDHRTAARLECGRDVPGIGSGYAGNETGALACRSECQRPEQGREREAEAAREEHRSDCKPVIDCDESAIQAGVGVRGLGFGIRDSWFGIWDLGFVVRDLGFGIRGSAFGLVLVSAVAVAAITSTSMPASMAAQNPLASPHRIILDTDFAIPPEDDGLALAL